MKDPEKAAELRAHLQRLDQQLTADAAAQRRAQLVSGIKVSRQQLHPDRRDHVPCRRAQPLVLEAMLSSGW